MSDNVNGVLVETINDDKTSKTISNIASEILTPFGLNNDKFVYAETICWLQEKLQHDVVLSGQKYYILSKTATVEDLFKLVGTEVPVTKLSTIDINFPRVDLPGIYYDMDGNFIKTEGGENDWNTVFVNDNDISKYIASLADFEMMTAALYGETKESNYTLEEMQAIGDVIMNRVTIRATSISDEITAHGQVNGYNSASQTTTANNRTSKNNKRLNAARKATITTLQGTSKGMSNGAYFWDGADIAITDKSDCYYNNHRDWGIYYKDIKHDIYETGNLLHEPITKYYSLPDGKKGGIQGVYTHMYDSTAAYGGTVFWKKNKDYKKALGEKKEFP